MRFFVNTPYTANAQKIVFAADATLPAISFGDTNTLQADETFDSVQHIDFHGNCAIYLKPWDC